MPDGAEINAEEQGSPSFLNNSDGDMKVKVQCMASKTPGFWS